MSETKVLSRLNTLARPNGGWQYPEQAMNMLQKCGLISWSHDPETPEGDRFYAIAISVLRWALLESFNGAIPPLRVLRERFTQVWKRTYYPDLGNAPAPPQHPTFWAGPKKAAGIAARMVGFLRKFEVIHPVQPYQHIVGERIFTGEYALIRKKTSKRYHVLVYHSHRPQSAPAPTPSDLIRWRHALRTAGVDGTLGLYHLPLLRGDSWSVNTLDGSVAYEMIRGWITSLELCTIASPGSHCKECVEKECLKVYG